MFLCCPHLNTIYSCHVAGRHLPHVAFDPIVNSRRDFERLKQLPKEQANLIELLVRTEEPHLLAAGDESWWLTHNEPFIRSLVSMGPRGWMLEFPSRAVRWGVTLSVRRPAALAAEEEAIHQAQQEAAEQGLPHFPSWDVYDDGPMDDCDMSIEDTVKHLRQFHVQIGVWPAAANEADTTASGLEATNLPVIGESQAETDGPTSQAAAANVNSQTTAAVGSSNIGDCVRQLPVRQASFSGSVHNSDQHRMSDTCIGPSQHTERESAGTTEVTNVVLPGEVNLG
jgi:hypothetical protein